MEHTEAMERMMAERYLLGELLEEDRDAFEEHFFGCHECAAAVRDGAVLIDSGRGVTRRGGNVVAMRPRIPSWLAAAATVAITVTSYQAYIIPTKMAQIGTPRVLTTVNAPASVVRGSQILPKINAPANTPLRLVLDLAPDPVYDSYRCTIAGARGPAGRPFVVPATAITRDGVSVGVPTGLEAGKYEIRLQRQTRQGDQVAVATCQLDVQ